MTYSAARALAALCSGAGLTLAFAPFHLFPLGILMPAFLLYLWYFSTSRQAFLLGWFFGVGLFSTGVYWVYISIHTFGKAPVILAFLITVLFIALLALFFGVQGWLTRRLFKGHQILWGFPIIWVLFEVVRTYLLTGFPWLLLGYTQMDSVVCHIAPLFGVYGVSGVTLMFSSLFAALFLIKRRRLLWGFPFMGIALWLGLWGMGRLAWGVQPTGQQLSVSLVQGNVHQSLKWDARQLQAILNTYRRLTEPHWSSDLIIWPEAAVPMLQDQAQTFLDGLDTLAKRHNAAVIFGIPVLYDMNFYNGIMTVGKGQGTYLKRHLVPFGEYTPFRIWLSFILQHIDIPMSDMTPGSAQQGSLSVKGIPISASICYEIAYPTLIASQLPEAQILITLTDDSWFDPSIARDQQLQITQMRALETGRYLLAATNDGITAVINSKGQVVKSIKPSQEGVLTIQVPALQGSTPWVEVLNRLRALLVRQDGDAI